MTNIAELPRRIGVELDPQLRALLTDVLAEQGSRVQRGYGHRAVDVVVRNGDHVLAEDYIAVAFEGDCFGSG